MLQADDGVILTPDEQDLLTVMGQDLNTALDQMQRAEKSVTLRQEMLRQVWQMVVARHGLDPLDFAASWDGSRVVITAKKRAS